MLVSGTEKIKRGRDIVLALHKGLLDSERAAYQADMHYVPTPGQFLNLVINDSYFAWLQPMTKLIVNIDESLSAKNSPVNAEQIGAFENELRALTKPTGRYAQVLEREPDLMEHVRMLQSVLD